MKTSVEHLPEHKREQLAAITALLQAEAQAEMVILFGSHARGDWVEDPETGYQSDYDILVVAPPEIARKNGLWTDLSQRAKALAGRTPVRVIAHDIKEINHELRLGQYFFIDILREGVVLFDSRRYMLASPKALTPEDRLKLGLVNFRYWFSSASELWRGAGYFAGRALGPQAAFLLHQTVERYAAAVLLVYTGYKPKSHDIQDLANEIASLHPSLAGALPRAEGEDKRLFDLLRRGYIDARYSRGYKITGEELRILRERVHDLAGRVHEACAERLAAFCGPEQVGPLPEVPRVEEAGEVPGAPPADDPAAFEAWRETLMALSYERGKEAGKQEGISEGFDRGKQEGVIEGVERGKQEGQIEALRAILAARGIPVDPESQAKIDATRDPDALRALLARALTVPSAADLFAPATPS